MKRATHKRQVSVRDWNLNKDITDKDKDNNKRNNTNN
jgi:hypothetical protein